MTKLVGVSCTHLGGDGTVSWIIEVDKGSRGEATGNMVEVEANGGDMYYPLNSAAAPYIDRHLVLSAIIG